MGRSRDHSLLLECLCFDRPVIGPAVEMVTKRDARKRYTRAWDLADSVIGVERCGVLTLEPCSLIHLPVSASGDWSSLFHLQLRWAFKLS